MGAISGKCHQLGFFVPGGEPPFVGEKPSLFCILMLLILLLLLCVSYSIALYFK